MKLVSYLLLFFMTVLVGNAVAQNPTILTGNYITNVFGQSNFIKNPNAQINTLNITVSGGGSPTASVTRSTTTPLVATTEFLVGVSSANGTITWDTRAFDSGMKNQNCEARFSYRGFQSTSKAHIKQGANTVATLNLSATGTDPRIASINFPCGDLSSATTFVITDTSTLGGTNEIGGIYLGLATNQANVAQAEFVGATELVNCNTAHVVTSSSYANFSSPTCTRNNFGAATTSTNDLSVTIPSAKPGWYFVKWNGTPYVDAGSNAACYWSLKEDTQGYIGGASYQNAPVGFASSLGASQLTMDLSTTTTATRTFRVVARSVTGLSCKVDVTTATPSTVLSVFRFPTSSELVVTPERQNVFGTASWPVGNTGGIYAFSTTSTTAQTVTASGFASGSATYYGAASASGTTNAFGMKVANIPPGVYRVSAQVSVHNQSAGYDCSAELHDDGGRIGAIASSIMNNSWANGQKNIVTIYRVTSFQSSREFLIKLRSDNAATTCSVNNGNGGVFNPSIVFEPLDQPSNSALYVQGPVKAAATGDVTPIGFQNYIVGTTNSSLGIIPSSGGSWRSGTGITLTPGLWEIKVTTSIGNVAPTEVRAGITDTPNSAPIADSTGFDTSFYVDDASNTCCVLYARTDGIFRVTTTKTFYPVALAYPGGGNFNYTFAIRARQLD